MKASAPALMPEPVQTALYVLDGYLPLGLNLDPVKYHPGLIDFGCEIFQPETILEHCSEPQARNCIAPELFREATCDDERAVNEPRLTAHGRELAARVYLKAAENALATLTDLAQGRLLQHQPRLRARLCVATREELRVLVREWKAVQKEAQP